MGHEATIQAVTAQCAATAEIRALGALAHALASGASVADASVLADAERARADREHASLANAPRPVVRVDDGGDPDRAHALRDGGGTGAELSRRAAAGAPCDGPHVRDMLVASELAATGVSAARLGAPNARARRAARRAGLAPRTLRAAELVASIARECATRATLLGSLRVTQRERRAALRVVRRAYGL